MISVCIPIYNFDVSQLLDELSRQSNQMDVPCEIILIDDCSSEKYKKLNESGCKKHTYIELDKNIGRAKIRNLFPDYANFEHLLFLDCDVTIVSKGFLASYINVVKQGDNNIICGGTIYSNLKPERDKLLRWKYGIRRESQSIEARKLSPNKSFMTPNFLIFKKIFKEVKFDERITEYGHEDTLFGFELKKKGITVYHIDNPILIEDIEENSKFLEKTEQGIFSLINVLAYTDYDSEFKQDINILNIYEKLKSRGLINLVYIVFTLVKPLLKFLFVKGYVNLRLFDFYKLGTLIQGFKLRKIKGV